MLVNGLADHFGSISVLREEPEPKLAIIRRRARLIGWAEALGQAAFGVAPEAHLAAQRGAPRRHLGGARSRPPARRRAGLARHRLGERAGVPHRRCANSPPMWSSCTAHASSSARRSMRGRALHQLPRRRQPQVSRPERRLLGAQPGDPAHAGVTVHLVDEGVDTGDVLYQAATDFSPDDNIATYQHRQMATALPLLIRADRGCARRPPRSAPRRAALAPVVPPHAVGLPPHRHAAGRVVISRRYPTSIYARSSLSSGPSRPGSIGHLTAGRLRYAFMCRCSER